MTDRLDWVTDQLDKLSETTARRHLRIRESPHVSGKVQIDGTPYFDFASNDYLGLSADQRLVDAVKSNVGYVGWGSGASPLIHGRGTLHARLEAELAAFENRDSALLFSSGYAANVGTIPALAVAGDIIFSDEKNHASIIDGCRLSKAKTLVYRHNDMRHLTELMHAHAAVGKKLVVTDGLFSIDGDLAKLPDIAEICDQHSAMLLVDEAHATGVFGENGRGVSEHLGVHDRVDITVGTLSKAIGCHGGFVAATQPLVDWLTNQARSYVFSTAPPDSTCMAAVKSLEIIRNEPDSGAQLLQKSKKFRSALEDIGLQIGATESQIVSVILEENQRTMAASDLLMKQGYFVPGIRPPTVQENQACLRISLTLAHTDDAIAGLLENLKRLKG